MNHDKYLKEVMGEVVKNTVGLIESVVESGEEYDIVALVREAQVYANSCIPIEFAEDYEVLVGTVEEKKQLYVGWRAKVKELVH